MIKGWRDGIAYYMATDAPELLEAFARMVERWEYVR